MAGRDILNVGFQSCPEVMTRHHEEKFMTEVVTGHNQSLQVGHERCS